MFHLSLYPVFDSYLLVAIVALVLVGLLWFGPSRQKLGRGRRVVLALLRVIVIVAVVLAMLRPTLIYMQTKKQSATLVVLADQSRSMSVPDAVGNKTRWDALRDSLAEAAPGSRDDGHSAVQSELIQDRHAPVSFLKVGLLQRIH